MIFRWFLPNHVVRHRDTEPEGGIGLIGRYLASDFGGSLLVSASTALLPLVVLATAGAKASAYYYIAWTVAYSMQMFSLNMGISLSVEGAARRSEVGPGMRRMLRLLVGLQMPLVVLVAILAPLILQVFGGAYSDEGAMLLRLWPWASFRTASTRSVSEWPAPDDSSALLSSRSRQLRPACSWLWLSSSCRRWVSPASASLSS